MGDMGCARPAADVAVTAAPTSRHRSRRRIRIAALCVAVLGAGACSTDAEPRVDRSIAAFAEGPAPTGMRQWTCAITSDQGPVVLSFYLPRSYDEVEVPGPQSAAVAGQELCRWTAPPPPEVDEPAADTIVTLQRVGDPYVDDLRARAEQLRADVGVIGDDGIFDLELRTDVPVFGDTIGDRLTYRCSCDAISEDVRQAQFAGVQLSFASDAGDREAAAAFEAALASGGLVEEIR